MCASSYENEYNLEIYELLELSQKDLKQLGTLIFLEILTIFLLLSYFFPNRGIWGPLHWAPGIEWITESPRVVFKGLMRPGVATTISSLFFHFVSSLAQRDNRQ